MLLYAGIDEAGYGPMLGPLCIGSSLFQLHDSDPVEGAPDLWSLLADAVSRRPADKKRRIAIDDSKTLKGSPGSRAHPLRHLERGVLAFLHAATETMPRTDKAMYDLLGSRMACEPWYVDEVELPLAGTAEEHRISAAVLGRTLDSAGIEVRSIGCEVIQAHQINSAARSHERKSDLNLGAALRMVDQIRREHAKLHPRVVIDRHGGRSHYREHLALAWPEARIQVLAETDRISRYRIDFPEGLLTISFEAESEQNHLPVALASMTAKLVRELHMIRLNRFFATQLPELKPTAGYVQDGRRFMREIDPLVRSLDLDEARLVRRV